MNWLIYNPVKRELFCVKCHPVQPTNGFNCGLIPTKSFHYIFTLIVPYLNLMFQFSKMQVNDGRMTQNQARHLNFLGLCPLKNRSRDIIIMALLLFSKGHNLNS